MHVMPHGRHCRSQNPRPNVIRNAVQSGCNTRTLRDGSIITGHGIDRSDYCLIAYVKTGSARHARDWAYWRNRQGVTAYAVDEQGTETGVAFCTAYRVIGTVRALEALTRLPCIARWHFEESLRLPQLQRPNPVHGPRLPVSEREELRHATIAYLTQTDEATASARAVTPTKPRTDATLASFIPAAR